MDSVTPTSIPTKILSIGKKLAPILGTLSGFLGDPMADGRGFSGAPAFMYDVTTGPNGIFQGHIANPMITTKIALTMPDKYPIMAGAVSALGGWIGEQVGQGIDQPLVTSAGTMFKRFGLAQAISSIVAGWLWLGRLNPEGSPGYTQGAGPQGGSSAPSTVWRSRATAQIRNAAGFSVAAPRAS